MGCPYEFPPVLPGGDGGVELDSAQNDAELNDAEPSDGDTVDGGVGCGDGVVAGEEQCDDGNRDPGDGCSPDCEVECSNGSTTDCNPTGATKVPEAAFVDPSPPEGFVQCAGFVNTTQDDVTVDWEINCLGQERSLWIRYWDTATEPWILLGGGELSPSSTADYETQTFDAASTEGSEGLLNTGGVVFLKDAPSETLQIGRAHV